MDKEFMEMLSKIVEDSVRKTLENTLPKAIAGEIDKYFADHNAAQSAGGMVSRDAEEKKDLAPLLSSSAGIVERESEGGMPETKGEIAEDVFTGFEKEFLHLTGLDTKKGVFGGFSDSTNRSDKKIEDIKGAGEDFYSVFAKTSVMHGREFGGHLYSPYYFRRHLPGIFEQLLKIYGAARKAGLQISLLDFIAGKAEIILIVPVQSGDPKKVIREMLAKDAQMLPYSGDSWPWQVVLSNNKTLTALKVLQLCEINGVDAYTVGAECNNALHMGKLADQLHVLSGPDLSQIWDDKGLTAYGRRFLTKISAASRRAYCIEQEIAAHEGVLVQCDGSIYYVRIANDVQFSRLMNKRIRYEVGVLSLLEMYQNDIFDERKSFTPLSMVNRLYNTKCESYSEVKSELGGGLWLNHELADFAAVEEYIFRFVLAGLFYYKRDRIAFRGGSGEALDECAARISGYDEELLVQELERLIRDLLDDSGSWFSAEWGPLKRSQAF